MGESCRKSGLVRFFVLVAALSTHARAAETDGCIPVSGKLHSQTVAIGQPLSDGMPCAAIPGTFCTTGRVTGRLNGTFDFTATSFDLIANPDAALTGIAYFTGELILRTSHGDLFFRDAGALNAIAGGDGSFASVLTIIEGTGVYSGATGRIRDEGIFINGCVDCQYRGEVCLAPDNGGND